MKIYLNPMLIILGLTGIIYLMAGFIQLKYPPRKINSLYGYRTKLSMKSKETWEFAQQFSAKKSLQIGLLMLILGIASIFLPTDTKEIQAWLSVLLVILFSGILIYLTEKKLKEKFEKIF